MGGSSPLLHRTARQNRGIPGVLSAGISTNATPPNSGSRQPIEIMGRPASQAQEAALEFVGPEYFATLQIPILSGRLWDQSEIARGATLVLVNQSFVRHYLSGGSIAGQSVRVPQFATLPPVALAANGATGWLEIVGVVGDSLNDGLDKPVAPAVYAPYTLLTLPFTQVPVRTQGDPLAMLHTIKRRSPPSTPTSKSPAIYVISKAGFNVSRSTPGAGLFRCSSPRSLCWHWFWRRWVYTASFPIPCFNARANSAFALLSGPSGVMCSGSWEYRPEPAWVWEFSPGSRSALVWAA